MQNPLNYQKLKEQYKLKSLELNKFKEDNERTLKSLSDLVASNRDEINWLKETIKKNEEEIALQHSLTVESHKSVSPLETTRNGKDSKRSATDTSKLLNEKIELLKTQLRGQKSLNWKTKEASEKIFQKNKLLIKKYEAFLYGDDAIDKKGTPPSAIIKKLKRDLGGKENDNKNLNHQLSFFLEENKELESKIMFLEEKEIVETSEFKPDTESRVAVTAEFSNGLESFLVTYSDLITLILVIFVLLYSISQVDPQKFSEVFSSFQEQELRYENNNARLSHDEIKMLARVRELVKDNVDPESLVRSDVRTILIRLRSSDLFSPGSAELIQGAEELILSSIHKDMQDGVKQVHVDGHTDDVPMKANQKFPTNWELSSVRAAHVARVIIDKFRFSPERTVVTGYGQYRPLKPNTSDLNRGLNRRVEIKILKDVKVTEQNLTIQSTKHTSKKSELEQNISPQKLIPIKTSFQKP